MMNHLPISPWSSTREDKYMRVGQKSIISSQIVKKPVVEKSLAMTVISPFSCCPHLNE